MEPKLTAPGLYLRGLETPPAAPLESAVTGFVGIAERGPINSPQRLDGWSDYVDVFGGFVRFGYLAESVFSFFRNGGERCWVVRAADTSKMSIVPASGQCPRVERLAIASRPFVDHNGDETVGIEALDPGGWGNRLEVRLSAAPPPLIRVTTLTQGTAVADTQITVASLLDLTPGARIRIAQPDGLTGARDVVIASGPGALNLATSRADLTAAIGAAFPAGSVVFAGGFRIEAEFRGRREVFDRLSMQSAHPRYFVSIVNGPEPLADYGERRRRGLSTLIRATHLPSGGPARFRPIATAATLLGGGDGFTQARAPFLNAALNPLVTIFAKRDRGTAGNGLLVTAIPFAARTAVPIPDVAGARDRIVVNDITGFLAGETVRLGPLTNPPIETATPSAVVVAENRLQLPADLLQTHPVGDTIAVADRFSLEARRTEDREPLETVRNISGNPAAGARFMPAALQNESELLCSDEPPVPFGTPLPPNQSPVAITLAGGADPGEMDPRYYTGYEANGSFFHPAELPPGSRVGLATLEEVEEVSLLAAPDVVRVHPSALVDTQRMLLRHCERMGDRFALLDSPADVTAAALENWIAGLSDGARQGFGAAFHPWVRSTFDDMPNVTPLSGFIAGVFARSDIERGVNKAPANELVKGAFGLVPPIDRTRQGELNPLGINCVLKLEDGEVRLMGSRTLSPDPAARYVNIRRTILAVRKTLSRRMLWAVFEPAGAALCSRIETTLTAFLQSLLAKGVTASQRPGDAFFVKCDAETNPPEQLRGGIVVAEVGIALLAPAEFIILTVRRTPDAVQVIEEEV